MLRAKYFSIAILFAFSRFCHMNIATYYIYLESCQDRFCYAVRGINISYNTENQDVSLVCAEPVSLDEEETLPRAIVEGATSYVPDEPQQYGLTPIQLCNDTNPLLLEHVQGDSHDVVVVVFHEDFDLAVLDKDYTNVNIVLFPHSVTINFQPNGSVNIIKPMWSKASEKTNLTFNETSSQCSVYEDANKRACICKENHARDHCLDRLRQKLDPSRKGYQYYHIYGRLTMNHLHYNYYFETNQDKVFEYSMYVQRYSASAVREAGGNESVSLCMSYNGSEAEVEDNWKRLICYGHSINIPITAHSNFTVFAKFHDGEWHSLLWFDYLKWSKSYIPGNCSYGEQVLDGIVHPFAICMRRNVTEKFYKNITQVDETSSTLRITECNDYAETSESIKETSQSINPSSVTPTLLDQDDTGFSRMDEVRNVEDETLQRFFNPFATTSSAPREITKMLIFSCFWFTNAVKRILAFEEHNLCDFLPLISAMLLNYYYNYYNCNNYF